MTARRRHLLFSSISDPMLSLLSQECEISLTSNKHGDQSFSVPHHFDGQVNLFQLTCKFPIAPVMTRLVHLVLKDLSNFLYNLTVMVLAAGQTLCIFCKTSIAALLSICFDCFANDL